MCVSFGFIASSSSLYIVDLVDLVDFLFPLLCPSTLMMSRHGCIIKSLSPSPGKLDTLPRSRTSARQTSGSAGPRRPCTWTGTHGTRTGTPPGGKRWKDSRFSQHQLVPSSSSTGSLFLINWFPLPHHQLVPSSSYRVATGPEKDFSHRCKLGKKTSVIQLPSVGT